jgi:hypothetical protein
VTVPDSPPPVSEAPFEPQPATTSAVVATVAINAVVLLLMIRAVMMRNPLVRRQKFIHCIQ